MKDLVQDKIVACLSLRLRSLFWPPPQRGKKKKKKEGVQPASRMPAARHLRMSLLAWTPNNPVDPPIKVDDGLGWLRVAGVATFASWPLQPFMYVLYICGLRPKGKT